MCGCTFIQAAKCFKHVPRCYNVWPHVETQSYIFCKYCVIYTCGHKMWLHSSSIRNFNFKLVKLPPNTLNNNKVDIELVINVITSVMCIQFLMFPALLNLFRSYIFCLIAFVEEVYACLGDICLVCLPSLPSFRELGCGFYREAQGGC